MSRNQTFNSYYLEMVVPFVYTEEEYKKLEEENKKLKEERDFFKEQAILWRKDYKNEYEENRKLESDLSLVIKERDDNIKQNKKLKEYNRRLKQANEDLRKQNRYWNKIVDIIPQDEKSVAEETIQDLQEKIRFLEQCLDNKEKVNKSLREENKRLSDFLECES
jgi:hypothetical protein